MINLTPFFTRSTVLDRGGAAAFFFCRDGQRASSGIFFVIVVHIGERRHEMIGISLKATAS